MLDSSQVKRIKESLGKRVQWRVQLKERSGYYLKSGAALFKIDHRDTRSTMSEAQRQVVDEVRHESLEPPLLVGIYDPETAITDIEEDIALSRKEYQEARGYGR